jgi:hypothetical protein
MTGAIARIAAGVSKRARFFTLSILRSDPVKNRYERLRR